MGSGVETDVAWLAGFLDAEGSFGLNRCIKPNVTQRIAVRYRPGIQVTNTHMGTQHVVAAILAAKGIEYNTHTTPTNDKWTVAAWGGTRCIAWINLLLPYLKVKRPEALLVREFCSYILATPNPGGRGRTYSAREWEILNIFGVKDTMQVRPTKGVRSPVLTTTPILFKASMLADEDMAWLAGFFDGEGSVMLNDKSRRGYWYKAAIVSLTNTNMPVLPYVHAIMDRYELSYNCSPYFVPGPTARMKLPYWRIETTGGQRTHAWLTTMMPYLHTKREKALALLEHIQANPGLTWRTDDARRQQVRDLFATGLYPIQAIAEFVGIGYGTAWRIIHNK